MGEQTGESSGAWAPHQRIVLPLSEAARASLASVRAAQEAARGRARQQTKRTRAWLGGIVGGIAVGALLFGPSVGGRDIGAGTTPASHASNASEAVVPKLTAAPESAQPAPTAVASPEALAAAAGVEANVAPVVETASFPSPNGPASPDADATCAESFGQRRWRLSIEACTRAFAARPTDAALALRIAHAQHARSRIPEAADWAQRAIALDSGLAEAFVIVAHGHIRAGNASAAVAAYRRYLTLAPRGWHATEARAAVRAHRREGHARRGKNSGANSSSVSVASAPAPTDPTTD